jgi:hypothetical protein
MDLNALTRWESLGKDLYQAGQVGREIQSLKRRSKQVDLARSEARSERSKVEETIEDETTPKHSRVSLSNLEAEELAILAKFRALRVKGRKLRVEEDSLEREVVQSSPSSGSSDLFPKGHQRWVYFAYRSLRRFGKGFLFGFCGKFAFALIGLLLRHKLSPRLLPDLLGLFVKPDLYRYGAFLGSFLMLFESSIRILRMQGWIGRQTSRKYHRSVRVILSAIVASTVAIQFLPKDVRLGISVFFVVRAMEILVRMMIEEQAKQYTTSSAALLAAAAAEAANKPGTSTDAGKAAILSAAEEEEKKGSGVVALTEVESTAAYDEDDSSATDSRALATLKQLRRTLKHFMVRLSKIPASNHFDTLVMALASSQVIWAWLFNRSTVEPGYLHFLDHHGGRIKCNQVGFVQLHTPEGIDPAVLGQINAIRSAEGRGVLDMNQPLTDVMCNLIHRETPYCSVAILDFAKKAYLRALPVYLPVYIIPMLLFKHRQLVRAPIRVLAPTFKNILRSSLFLSSYCTVAWATACTCTNLGVVTSVKGALAGFFGGTMVALEAKGRRVELALYVLSQSLPSAWRTLRQWKLLPRIPQGEALSFIGAMVVIMYAYVTRPHLLRSSYLSLLLMFFGSGGRSAGFSTRAVEHASTPKEAREALHESVSKMGPPILSPDPSMPGAQAVRSAIPPPSNYLQPNQPQSFSSSSSSDEHKESNSEQDGLRPQEGMTIGAGELLPMRHTTRLSIVEERDD